MDRWFADGALSQRFPFYTRANSGEVAPFPVTPMTDSLVWKFCSRGWADGLYRWGTVAPDELDDDRPEVISSFGSYVYLNWSLIRLHGERSPGLSADLMDAAFFGDHPDIPPYVAHADDDRPELAAKTQQTIDWLMSLTEVPVELTEDRAKMLEVRASRPDLTEVSDADLVRRAESMGPLMQEMFEPYFVYGTSTAFALGMLTELCSAMAPGTSARLLTGLGEIDSAPPSHAIWELGRLVRASPELTAEFDSGLEGLLDRIGQSSGGRDFSSLLASIQHEHGARGPVEWELANPTWETDHNLVLAIVDRMRLAGDELSPAHRHEAAAADRALAEAEVREALAGDEDAIATLELGMRLSNIFVPGRERTKLSQMMALHEARLPLHELGRRLTTRGHLEHPTDVFMLTMEELPAFLTDPESLQEELRSRAATFSTFGDLQEPFIIYGEVAPLAEWPTRTTNAAPAAIGDELPGVASSPGVVVGRARIITDPGDPRGIEPGDVLVAPLTDPAWTPLFITSAAVVVEVGAPMSHAMIVSREFGIPCVTGVTDICKRLPDGALIQVDGNTGTVTVLDL